MTNPSSSTRPIAIVGAGDLTSCVRREGSGSQARYSFNVFRIRRDERVTHGLRACDLRNLVKLCQVVASELIADGWLTDDQRRELTNLVAELDAATRSGSSATRE